MLSGMERSIQNGTDGTVTNSEVHKLLKRCKIKKGLLKCTTTSDKHKVDVAWNISFRKFSTCAPKKV